ncbi:MAG: beta-lactamase family protein [Fimbriimonadaceae bacterium]|nr:beta-lactamase family protein [Fimbriimonadaceae bacterium]
MLVRFWAAALALGSLMIGIGCGGSSGSTRQGFPPEMTAEASRQIEAFLTVGLAPGTIVSVSSPQGTWTKAFGVSNTATGEKMRTDMAFRIGSVTKTFTAQVILLLAQDGLLALDDPISDHLSGVPRGDEVTIRMMASMNSGIPSYSKNPEFVDLLLGDWVRTWQPQELPPYGYELDFPFDPNEGFDYSNTNTVLLGLLIEKIENKPLAQVFQERIFNPLGLTRTSFPSTNQMPAPFAHGYSSQNSANRYEDATFYSPSWGFSAGQLISTIEDLNVYAKSLGTGSLMSPQMMQERLKWRDVPPMSPLLHYAFGMVYVSGWLGHTGELPGYNTACYYNPSIQASIVVMTNSDRDFEHRAPAVVLLERMSKIFFPAHEIDYVNPIDPDEIVD